MYKSPIELVNSFTPMTVQRYDDAIMTEVLAKVDVIVDKEELMKALQYDRNQYMKGYQDGVEYAEHKPVEADWIPIGGHEDFYDWVGTCANCHSDIHYDNYCPNCGAKLIKPDRGIWWMPEEEPEPEKPKPEGYGECWACRYAAWDGKEKDWTCNSDAYNEGVVDGKASVQNRPPLTYGDLWQKTTMPQTNPIYYGTEITCGQNSE